VELAEFEVNVARHRGRRLVLVAESLPLSVSGLCIATAVVDVIVYRQAASPPQQVHAIGHQVAHLLFGHQAIVSGSASQALLPHLDPSYVAAAVPVSCFAPADEMAAEEFASLLTAQALPARNALQRPL
jgi:hypothetical protein